MSWKSQQGYTLGYLLSETTVAINNIASGDNTVAYTSAPIPVGTWLVICNDFNIGGDIAQALMTVFVDGDPIASCGVLTDVSQFPSLTGAFRSNGTAEITIDFDCDTTAGVWSIGEGKVQLVKLTDN